MCHQKYVPVLAIAEETLHAFCFAFTVKLKLALSVSPESGACALTLCRMNKISEDPRPAAY